MCILFEKGVRGHPLKKGNDLSVELHAEFAAVKLENVNVVVLSCYRFLNGDINVFFEILGKVLEIVLNNSKTKIRLRGNYNKDVNIQPFK